MLSADKSVLLIVDVQGKLAQLMHDKQSLFTNLQKLINGIRIFEIPIIWTEQNPQRVGPTIPEIGDLLRGISPISKFSFSCCGEDNFRRAFNELCREEVLIAGIETHICVYQTARDLIDQQCKVEVVADAVSSRAAQNKHIGLEKCKQAGASITSVETILFELLQTAKDDRFKDILNIVK
jgi:nicotinamidase-related amidase